MLSRLVLGLAFIDLPSQYISSLLWPTQPDHPSMVGAVNTGDDLSTAGEEAACSA